MKNETTNFLNPADSKETGKERKSAAARFLHILPRLIYGILVPAVMAVVLYNLESDTLFRIQELNLFMPTRLFYNHFAVYPGGTLMWAACFFTQFFYYPALGAAMLALMWIGIFFLMRATFKTSSVWLPLLCAVPACLLAVITQTGYFIYYMKLEGYYLIPTIGMLFVFAATLVFERLRNQSYLQPAWMILWTAIGYPLFGAYALLGTGYMLLISLRAMDQTWRRRVINAILGALLIVAVPLIAYHFYTQTSIDQVYRAALPSFDLAGVIYPGYRRPYYLLFAIPVVLIALRDFNKPDKFWQTTLLHLVLLAGTYGIAKYFWYIDENFKKELRMNQAIEEEDWEKVIRISLEGSAEPTRQIVMFRDLALFRLGRAANEMFHYRQGAAVPNAPFPIRMVQSGGKTLYYNYGQGNYCYRWCMEDGVIFGWKVEYYKFMARVALLNGEYKLAKKYIDLIGSTMFHKKWAEKYAAYLNNPEKIKNSETFKTILSLRPQTNKLASDQSVIELFLLRQFAYTDSMDPVFQEQAVIAALQMKEIDPFWDRFSRYARLTVGKEMPIHFQEAAYLYGHLENKVDISHMPFDKGVVDSYNRFMAFSQQCAGMTEDQMAEAFYPEFGDTFYYFYFLVRGLHTY